MTKKELARLVRVTRRVGHFGNCEGEPNVWSFMCPVHREALDGAGEQHVLAHRFPVYHHPWERTPLAPLIAKALASHLEDAETNGEACNDLRTAAHR